MKNYPFKTHSNALNTHYGFKKSNLNCNYTNFAQILRSQFKIEAFLLERNCTNYSQYHQRNKKYVINYTIVWKSSDLWLNWCDELIRMICANMNLQMAAQFAAGRTVNSLYDFGTYIYGDSSCSKWWPWHILSCSWIKMKLKHTNVLLKSELHWKGTFVREIFCISIDFCL